MYEEPPLKCGSGASVKYLSRVASVQVSVSLVFLLLVAGCSRDRQEPRESIPAAGNEVVAKTTLLATIDEEEKPHRPPYFHVFFNDHGRGVAYLASLSGKTRLVHNGTAGMPITGFDQIAWSPDSRRMAYSAMVNGKWRMVIDGREGVVSDEVGESVFSPDSRHIAYAVKTGKAWHMVVDSGMGKGFRSIDGRPIFSADSKKIAYVEGFDDKGRFRLVVSDLAFRVQSVQESWGVQFLANRDKTRIAAVRVHKNGQRVIAFEFDQPDVVKEGPLYDMISHLTFGRDGVSVAYVAKKGVKRFLVLNGKKEPLPDGDLKGPLVIRPDTKGVGAIIGVKDGFFLHQAFVRNGKKEKKYEEVADLVYNEDGSLRAYAARQGESWSIVVNGKEGPAFDRVVTPLFSPDSRRLVYRVRQDGGRFVVIADASGKMIRKHPAYEMVFPPVFTTDGKSVAYGVKDGRKLIWKVEKL